MRLLVCLLLALPVYAQAPTRDIKFQCMAEYGLCAIGIADWEWVVNAMKSKDAEIDRLRAKVGCGSWRDT